MTRPLSALCAITLIISPLLAQDTQELFQGFEGSANDNWDYTASPPRYVADDGDDVWADTTNTSAISPATGQKFWFMRDLDNPNGGNPGFHAIDFEPVGVSGFVANSISFKYFTIGYEDQDSIGYILETEPGAGFDMANYVGLNRNTGEWTTVYITLPPGAAEARLRLMAKQDGSTDFAGFDDISIFSSTEDVISPLVVGAEVTGARSVRIYYSEPMAPASVEDPANYTANAAISTIAYAEPPAGPPYADITFSEDFTAGQAYSLTVGLVADLAGNFLLFPFTFDFLYNNTVPQLVITEIFYNPPSDNDQEFIEIYNAGDTEAALGGLQLSGEFSFTFPAGLGLPAGEVVLLAYDEAVAEAFFGQDFIGWGATDRLGNGGGDLLIVNSSGAVIDQVNYDDNDPWPPDADGNGPSLELISATLDNNTGSNWRATATQFGDTDVFATPGIISDDLMPSVAFVNTAAAAEEGADPYLLPVRVTSSNAMPTRAILSVAGASTAVEGVDYKLLSDTITFPPFSTDPQFAELLLPENNSLGGKYVIVEIEELINGGPGANDKSIILIRDNDIETPAPPASPGIRLSHLGSFEAGASAEAVAHSPARQRLFVANAADNRLDIIDFADPAGLGPANSIDLSAFFNGQANCVAVYDTLVAVSMAGPNASVPGRVLFFNADGFLLNSVKVGFLPDMLAFTPDGTKVLAANEGGPSSDYLLDPEGSVSIIGLEPGIGSLTDADVKTVDFAGLNADSASLVAQGIRIFGPGATVAQDLEPEYIAISDDGLTAYAACQENNALITIDIVAATVKSIVPLGYKDWSEEGVFFDASDRSPAVFFASWPVKGMYQPDATAYFSVGGQEFLITANEGNARAYDGFSEEVRVGDSAITLDPTVFPDAAYLKEEALLGRLQVSSANGDLDGDGDYDELYAYGGRSFSIWNANTGELAYDSGSALETIVANDPVFGLLFNADENENLAKGRSDDKGPEPEAVAVGTVNGIPYAFIGMERIGGVMAFSLSDPAAPQYIQYINTRTLGLPGGDLSPEEVIFIPAEDSPNGNALIVASYEVSGTLAVFEVQEGATAGFARPSSIISEGSGAFTIELAVENAGGVAGELTVRVIDASTALEGEDYALAGATVSIPADNTDPQFLELEILENNAPGGRYLILELDLPDGSPLRLGSESRHTVLIQDNDDGAPVAQPSLSAQLSYLSSFGLGAGASAEIVSYDPGSSHLFVANSSQNELAILDFSNPAGITLLQTVVLDAFGAGITCVAASNGIVAVSMTGADADSPGTVAFFDVSGNFISSVEVGVFPDMVLFSPDGARVLTANEGQPSDDYAVDPEGSVSIIDISGGLQNATVTTVGFEAFNAQQASLMAQGVRIFGPGATVAQDLEPEYIAISDDGSAAYVACQENNALAIVDLAVPEISAILPLGYKDWTDEGASLDASDRSGGIFFANWPLRGMYQPDAIDYFSVGGQGYLITANEGDARNYDGFSEEFRIGDDEIVLDPAAFPDGAYLKDSALLGRLRISSASGDTDGDGDYDQLFAYGGRSFSIWDAATGALVYDSGNDMEYITAEDPVFGSLFNANNEDNGLKGRSDDKGPEPEAVIVVEIDGRPFAFIGLERIGGIMVYDLSDPGAPVFVQYVNSRSADMAGGDLGPESIIHIAPEQSPDGKGYILASNEISGTLSVFEMEAAPTISFAEARSIVAEGAGALQLELAIERPGAASGEAFIRAVSASTAVGGEDYTLAFTTVSFEGGINDPQYLELNILDNNSLSGRYLILEIDAAASSVRVGSQNRHIMLIQDTDDAAPIARDDPYVQLAYLGSINLPDGASAEIVDFDGASRRLFVANSSENKLEILDYSDPGAVSFVESIPLSTFGGGVNCVAARDGIVAVAVQGFSTDGAGQVVFFDTDGLFLNAVNVGALPDMLLFTPDGSKVLTANEGEPNSDYSIDPEGSISIIDIGGGVMNATVTALGFQAFNAQQAALAAQGVRFYGPNATVAQDLEPEHITISDDGATAYVACQENNALAVISLAVPQVSAILPLGSKNWQAQGFTFDASDRPPGIFFANWPVRGLYQPDAIEYFNVGGQGYLITANEGDARDYDTFTEEFRVGDDEIALDPAAFPDGEYLKDDALLGRLRISSASGDTDGDGDYDQLFAYGARSFTIWNATTGALAYDSGNDLEKITAADPVFGQIFNSDSEENDIKARSDDKGPEPEAVVVAEIDGGFYAFIGLERIGGVVVYDVSNPVAPQFIQYINTRNLLPEGSGDISPEGLAFIPASASPSGRPLLAVSHEVSGSVAMFELQLSCPITPLPETVNICEGDAALLEVSGAYAEVNWSNGETGASIEVGQPGVYAVLATTASGCMAMDTVEVVVNPLPVASLGEDVVACDGETVTLDAGPGFVTYAWSIPSVAPSVEVMDAGAYSVTVSDVNGCEASDTATVSFNPLPVISLPPDTTICAEDVTLFEAGPGNVFIIDGEALAAFVVVGYAPGAYSAEALVVNTFGCLLPVEINFTVDICVGTESIATGESFELFPNPASGLVVVRLHGLSASDYRLDILAADGQLLRRILIPPLQGEYQAEISLAGMPAGAYLVRLASGKGIRVRRLIVE